MIPIPYAKEILAGLLALSLTALAVQSIRLDRAQDKYVAFQSASKDLLIDAYKEMNKQNVAAELAQSQLDVQYQRGKRDATELSKSVAADLSADNERLQVQWRAALRRASQAEATATNSGRDGEADELRRDIENVVRRAAEGDARIVRLQNRIDGYLKQINGRGWYVGRYVEDASSNGTAFNWRVYDYENFSRTEISGRGLPETVWAAPTLGPDTERDSWSGWNAGSGNESEDRLADASGFISQGIRSREGTGPPVPSQRYGD
jgi:hypothetical protein